MSDNVYYVNLYKSMNKSGELSDKCPISPLFLIFSHMCG